MKTVVFFSRCDLGKMYGPVSNELKGQVNCIHVAYSKMEYDELVNSFGIESKNIILFKDELKKFLEKPYTEEDLEELDDKIITASNGRFNLNQSIQSDRALIYKSFEECNKLAVAMFRFWDDFFKKYQPVAIFHEMTSLLMNHMACICAKLNNAYYINENEIPGLYDGNILFCTYEGDWPKLTKEVGSDFDKSQVKNFIGNFRNAPPSVLMGHLFKDKKFSKLFLSAKRRVLSRKFKSIYKNDSLVDYIDYFLEQGNEALNEYRNLKAYKKINWDKFESNAKYYYFPFHLEPEAAVFYWGDGLYANQVKLIENIAAQLPAGTYLYVKDHPHDIGYRSAEDYLRLQKIPNIKVLYAKEPGKEIIKHSQGVITINGSAGFEALLLGKQVYYMGHPYYEACSNTYKVQNIKDLGRIIKEHRNNKFNEEGLEEFVSKLFANSYKGNAGLFYAGRETSEENTKDVIIAFTTFIKDELF